LLAAATGKDRLGNNELRFTPVNELLEAVAAQRGPRLRQLLTELEQRRGNPVLVTLALAAVHEEAEVCQLASNLLQRYLAHKPTAKEQQQAATKLHLHKLLAQSGKTDRARDRYRELILEYSRTSAAEEARRLLAGKE